MRHNAQETLRKQLLADGDIGQSLGIDERSFSTGSFSGYVCSLLSWVLYIPLEVPVTSSPVSKRIMTFRVGRALPVPQWVAKVGGFR
jgi:hypothetical protein